MEFSFFLTFMSRNITVFFISFDYTLHTKKESKITRYKMFF
eukprot:UN27202